MRSTNNPFADGFSWDGSPKNYRPPRPLRVAADSPSRLLRAGQRRRCSLCGNLIEWYYRDNDKPVSLHPVELPATAVPEHHRWHLASGIAYPTWDGTDWSRIPHLILCPHAPHAAHRTGLLAELRRALGVHHRHLLDTAAFTPRTDSVPPTRENDRPGRPVVQFLYLRYLAPAPVEDIRCVAQTRARHRCPNALLGADDLAGAWILHPLHPDTGQLPLGHAAMAVYDLTGLPYAEQLRWRAQRCTAHAAAPAAPDTALTDWEPFDPLLHHQHTTPHLPHDAPRGGRR